VYYIGKILQASGLTIILFGFLQAFPELMSHKQLVVGIMLFCCGWLADRFLLKR